MIDICLECEKHAAERGSEYCSDCGEKLIAEWQQEQKDQEAEYYSTRL